MIRAYAILLGLFASVPVLGASDVKNGQKLAETYCARCHVVGDFNKFGGIGSTPSFGLLMGMADGIERFRTFYERRPHPAFVSVPGVPRWTDLPPYAMPLEVTPENIDDLIIFVRKLK